MDILTVKRVLKGNIKGFVNFLFFKDKNRAENYLFVDMTEVHRFDNGTGVPRVTDNIAANLKNMNLPFKIKEIYARPHKEGFYYCENDKPVKIRKGDFFFGLDFSKFLIPNNKRFIKKIRKEGIPVWFFLHDLIPINYPQYCQKQEVKYFKKWIDVVKKSDGFIANSKTTQEEMKKWLSKQPENSWNKNIKSGFIHIACTFNANESKFLKFDEAKPLQFLAVSRVEPRKRYDLIQQAFEKLWHEGFDISLHIVGKPAWENEADAENIRKSPEYGKKLFWHDKFISDEELGKLYEKSCALIFASDVEGFGSPLVEGAMYKKPLIIRDIPIFHEVAGNQATFFTESGESDLYHTLKKWIKLYSEGKIEPPKIKLYTWKESTEETCRILFPDLI